MSSRAVQPSRMSIWEYIGGPDKQLVIPVYQRNYSWLADDQVKRLLDDMMSVIEGRAKNHFTGIFMSVEVPIQHRFSQIQLVDGQQRLTTLFLLLWALKEVYKGDPSIKNVDDLLYNSDMVQRNYGEKYRLKLKPLIGDNDVYQKIAKGAKKDKFSENERESKVFKNYEFIVKYLKNHESATVDAVLDALANMDIVNIPLDDEDDPQQIFESINALGLELAPLDLIRNLVLMKIEADDQNNLYNDYWKKIEGVFPGKQSKNLEDLFRLYIAIKNFVLVKNDDLYSEFQSYWRSKVSSIEDRQIILTDLFDYASYYKELYFDEKYYPISDSRFKQIITDFRKIGSSTIAPFILEIYALYKKELVTSDSLTKILSLMNSYIIRRECAGFPMNDASRFFPQLLKNIEKEIDSLGDYSSVYNLTLKYLVNMNKNNSLGLPTDERVKNYLLTNNAYTLSHSLLFLTRLENKDNSTPIVDTSTLSIEHIMPQTQDDPGYWRRVVGEKELENYAMHCNKIGNLTIVSTRDNSAMRNNSFEKKKEFLQQSKHIKMNEPILLKEKWDIEEIDKRTLLMINAINTEFKYVSAIVDKKISYVVHFNKNSKTINVHCDAKMFNGGDVIVSEDTITAYKSGSSYMEREKIKEALACGFLIINPDKTVTLKQDSKFSSIDVLTEVLMGELSKNYKNNWSVEDGVSIENVISLLN